MKKITGKQLKEAVEWLYENKCGCCHFHLLTDDKGREWSIVIGWSDGFDENEEGDFSDEGFHICSKIAFQEWNAGMQTDYDWDFKMPCYPNSNDICDTSTDIARDVEWDSYAEFLNKEFKDVTDLCAYFELEEEEAA